MTPEQIKEKYEPRIITILTAMRTALLEYDLRVESPWLMEDDEFSWWMLVQTEAEAKQSAESTELAGVDIRFTILESEHCDGEENGVNFAVDIASIEGEVIGGMTPFNYTEKVWVSRDDEEAIEERFAIFEKADQESVAELITNWIEEKAA